MLLVKFTAKDLRTIETATPESVVSLVKTCIADALRQKQTKVEHDPGVRKTMYLWREARDDLKAVLGDKLIVPPYPDTSWYANVNKAIKEQGMDTAYVTSLANYVKANLNAPYSMDFVIRQHARILGGAWGKHSSVASTKVNWLNDTLPD